MKRILALTGSVLLVVASAAFIGCGLFLLRAHLVQRSAFAALKHQVSGHSANPRIEVQPRGLLGKIEIPRIGVSSAVLEGVDEKTLALSVGHVPGTALPGSDGNVALAGHRDTFFRGLEHIRVGDNIVLTSTGGDREYHVDSTRIVRPTDVWVLRETGNPALTLITCYPFHYVGPAPERFIVQAHPEYNAPAVTSESINPAR